MRSHRTPLRGLAALATVAITVMSGCLMTPVEPHLARSTTNSGSGAPLVGITAQRPISDFISAQGSTSLFFPPFPDFIGWANNNPQTRFAAIDYTGLIAAYLQNNGGPTLGTQVSGSVSERSLADGRAEVSVILHTTRAMSWATSLPGDLATNPLLFGYRQGDLLANPSLKPGLSTVNMRVVFKNDAPGAPLPDLVNAFILGNATPAQQLMFLEFRSDGPGPLHSLFGVPDGTPGRLQVTQTGLFVTKGGGSTADGFPAEHVELRAVGRGTAAP